jgi:type VI protein secretion system component VasK
VARVDQSSGLRTSNLSLWMLGVTSGILALWGVWALFEALVHPVYLSFTSFGLISPLIGLFCVAFSIVGLLQARRLGAPQRYALGAIVLSVVIGVVPFAALPFDPS